MSLDLGPTSDDWVGALASPEVYQSAMRNLSRELRESRSALIAERQGRKEEITRLRAELAEGLTPELLQLRRSVSSWRSRALAAESRLREARRAEVSNGSR